MIKSIDQFRADCLEVIESYQSDLDIDLNTILAGTPALFFAYECGSHSIELRPFDTYPPAGDTVPYLFGRADREHILAGVGTTLECESVRNAPLVHYYDGKTIKQIDHARAAIIVQDYRHAMGLQFRKHNGLQVA